MKSVVEVPAGMANEVSIVVSPDGWKLIFGESQNSDGRDINYHTAVFLPNGLVGRFLELTIKLRDMKPGDAVQDQK